jgi:dienelactone hydrolase
MRSEPISFYSGGHRIAAMLTIPVEGPSPALILCQGLVGMKEHYRFPELAQTLAERGYAVLAFDYVGIGESEGPRGRVMPLEHVQNVRDAVTLMGTLPQVRADSIGLVGFCWGGAHAVYAGSVDPRVRGVAEIVGMSDGSRWLRSLRRHHEWQEFQKRLEEDRATRVTTGVSAVVRPGEVLIGSPMAKLGRDRIQNEIAPPSPPYRNPDLTLESAERILEYKPQEVVARLAPRPLLIVHAEADDLTPIDEAYALYDAATGPKRMITIPGACHHDVYLDPMFGEIVAHLVDWLDEWLPGGVASEGPGAVRSS